LECRRHVGVREAACPFCRVALGAAAPRPTSTATRLGRAAIFAGATLTACWTGSSPRKDDTIEHKQGVVEQKPGAIPPGTIRGTLRNAANGQPLSGYQIILVSDSGQSQTAVTDPNGEYAFTGLQPANYTVSYEPKNPHQDSAEHPITLQPEAGERADLSILIPPPDRGPCCKPYGAPPARRRIV
jgi:hypothetical protein